jgi:hypothetical protein
LQGAGKVGGQISIGAAGWIERLALPWGDLIMMRRQLLNFKALAERGYPATS